MVIDSKTKISSMLSTTPNTSFVEDKNDSEIPPKRPSSKSKSNVQLRIENLRPTRELLEFYRKKIAEYDDQHADMFDRISNIETVCDNNQKLQNDIKSRDNEISNLQKALSDLQAYLLEERDHVLKLYAENDRLKISELDDKKKIAHLLALAGPAADECSYFLKDPPNHVSGIIPIKPDDKNLTQFEDRGDLKDLRKVSLEELKKVKSKNAISKNSTPNYVYQRSSKAQINKKCNSKPIVIKQASGVTVLEPAVAKHDNNTTKPNGNGPTILSPNYKNNSPTKFYKQNDPFKLNFTKNQKLKHQNKIFDDRQILALQIEALQSQLEEQTRLAKDQISTLVDDRRINLQEAEAQRKRDQIKVANLTQNLRKTQQLLTDSTREFLKIKSDHRSKERIYMGEKDQLCLELEELRDRIAGKNNYDPLLKSAFETKQTNSSRRTNGPKNLNNRLSPDATKIRTLEANNQTLKLELEQAIKLADMHRQQYLKLQEDTANVKESAEAQCASFREKSERLVKKLENSDHKYKSLEKRRATEIEGFKSDIKILRGRLKDMEKQILKISLGGPVTDLEVLKDLHKQTSKSREMQEQIRNLKNQIYSLESDFRNL